MGIKGSGIRASKRLGVPLWGGPMMRITVSLDVYTEALLLDITL